MPVCTHNFPCYFVCLYDTSGTVSGNTELSLLYAMGRNYCVSSEWEAELSVYLYVFMDLSLYLKCSLCYPSEIKELLIAYVFKCGLEMLTKLAYFKLNSAKDLKSKLGDRKNVVGSIPKRMPSMRKWLEAGAGAGALESWVWVPDLPYAGSVANHCLTCSWISPFILTLCSSLQGLCPTVRILVWGTVAALLIWALC